LASLRSLVDRLRQRPQRFIAIADLLFVALLFVAVAAELAGDFRTTLWGVRISVRSVWRIVGYAAVVAIVRHLMVPRPSVIDRLWPQPVIDAERARLFAAEALPRRQLLRRHVLVLLFFTVTTALMVPDYVRHPFSVPDHGDPLFSIWRLAWVAHQLPRDPLHLFDGNIFYPDVRTLAFSDAMLVPALAAAPLLWLGVHQVLVYHMIFFLAIVLSGYTMFLLVRALTASTGSALIAGLLFAFCLFRFLHFSHLELQVAHWIPLALFAFHRTVVTGQLRYGLLTGLAIALQALSSLYYGMFFVVFLTVLVAALWVSRHLSILTIVRPLSAGAALAALLVLPLTMPYWANRGTLGDRGAGEVQHFSAKPSDFLAAPANSLYRGRFTTAETGERELFPGFIPIALAIVALWPPLTPIRFAYGVGLIFAMDAALGFNGEVYHWLYGYLPPFRGLRVPARFGMIMTLVLSVLAGYGIARLASRVQTWKWRTALFAVCGVAVLIEMRPAVRAEPIWSTAPAIYNRLPQDGSAVLAEFPFPRPDGGFWHDARYMYFSTFHWRTLVNGNSGFIPYEYLVLIDKVQDFPSDLSVQVLRARGAQYVVLHEHFHFPEDYVRLVAAVDARPDLELIATDEWEGSEVRLYRFRK
jgi:hypothetical protein